MREPNASRGIQAGQHQGLGQTGKRQKGGLLKRALSLSGGVCPAENMIQNAPAKLVNIR